MRRELVLNSNDMGLSADVGLGSDGEPKKIAVTTGSAIRAVPERSNVIAPPHVNLAFSARISVSPILD